MTPEANLITTVVRCSGGLALFAMRPSKKQLALLFLFLVTAPVSDSATNQTHELPGGHALLQDTLTSLVEGPLRGKDLLVVSGNHSQHLLDVGRVMAAAGTSVTPIFFTSQNSLLHTSLPPNFTKGSHLTTIILFHRDPTAFLLLLADNKNWNPDYLVLFCLSPHLNTTSVLAQSVVQRSQFILLLQPQHQDGQQRIIAYTSLPERIKVPLGIWNLDKFPCRQSLFMPRFLDFSGQILGVAAQCLDEPFVYFDDEGNCIGSNLDALQILGEKLNFRITVRDDAPVWGSKVNGTWDGMLGQVMYEGEEFIVNVMQPVPERVSDFDFTYPYWEDGFGVIVRVPPPMPLWRNVLYPFSTLMWGLLFITTVTVASTLAILLYCLHIITDPISYTLKVGCGVLSQPMPEGDVVVVWWGRVWLVVWWVAVDILAAAYTSNLVAVLTVPVYPDSINTLFELAESDLIPSMIDYGDFAPVAMKNSKHPVLAKIGKKLYLGPDDLSRNPYAPLLKKVAAGTHALIVTMDYLIYSQHKNGLTRTAYIMDEKIFPSYMSWFLPKNTPYTTTISNHVTRLLETGIMAKLYRDHIGRFVGKETQVVSDVVLNLGHLQGAFIALALGLVAAFIALLMERFTYPTLNPMHQPFT